MRIQFLSSQLQTNGELRGRQTNLQPKKRHIQSNDGPSHQLTKLLGHSCWVIFCRDGIPKVGLLRWPPVTSGTRDVDEMSATCNKNRQLSEEWFVTQYCMLYIYSV